jgi:hypothetical protein
LQAWFLEENILHGPEWLIFWRK